MTARKIPKPGSENQRAQRDGCGGFACALGTIRVRRGVRLTTILHEEEILEMGCTLRLWTGCCILVLSTVVRGQYGRAPKSGSITI